MCFENNACMSECSFYYQVFYFLKHLTNREKYVGHGAFQLH